MPFSKLILSSSAEVQLQPGIPRAAEVTRDAGISDLLAHTLQHLHEASRHVTAVAKVRMWFCCLLQGTNCCAFCSWAVPLIVHPLIGNTPSEWRDTLLWLFDRLL